MSVLVTLSLPTDIYYNAGHPGVEKPHVHVVLYHDSDAKARLAE